MGARSTHTTTKRREEERHKWRRESVKGVVRGREGVVSRRVACTSPSTRAASRAIWAWCVRPAVFQDGRHPRPYSLPSGSYGNQRGWTGRFRTGQGERGRTQLRQQCHKKYGVTKRACGGRTNIRPFILAATLTQCAAVGRRPWWYPRGYPSAYPPPELCWTRAGNSQAISSVKRMSAVPSQLVAEGVGVRVVDWVPAVGLFAVSFVAAGERQREKERKRRGEGCGLVYYTTPRRSTGPPVPL